ncbi:DUF3325 domain-containing protein [Duganella sp. BuS-21]|uniref:DUF3325 domain-containing protein n=1 Tax=Duganella sp. BuS-21 TaxID=2943848 RepID=UPI0035A68AA8
MNYATIVLTAAALCHAGMTALSLAIDRHHRQVYGCDTPHRRRTRLRVAGALLLALGMLPCVLLWGPGAGFVAWLGMLTIGALSPALLLPHWPRWVAPLAAIAGTLAIAGLAKLAFGQV